MIPTMKEMIEKAARSSHPKHRHAALIFRNEELLIWANNDNNAHAEVRAVDRAIIKARNMHWTSSAASKLYMKSLILISIAVTKTGKLKLAKPCPPCETYARNRGIKHILYTTNKGTVEKL